MNYFCQHLTISVYARKPEENGERPSRLSPPFPRYFPTQKPWNLPDFGRIPGFAFFGSPDKGDYVNF